MIRNVTVTAALAAAVTAQTELIVPASAALSDANISAAMPFGYYSMRMQQIWDGGQVCTTGAIISGMLMRVDKDSAAGAQPFTAQNLRVMLSHTSMTPATMSTTFQTNVTSPQTTLFQGNLNLPAQTPTTGKVMPFNLPAFAVTAPFTYVRANGDLLLEMVSDPPNGKPAYFVDAATNGGNVVAFGTSGSIAGDNLSFHVTSPLSQLVPGGTLDISTETTFKSYPGELMMGFSDLPVPWDLTPFGATGNSLYIGPIASAPHVFQGTPIGWASLFTLPIPNTPGVIGAQVYAQSYLLEPTANPAGLVTTHALEMTVGDLAPMPMMLIGTPNSTSATGNPSYGAGQGGVVVKFQGAFQ